MNFRILFVALSLLLLPLSVLAESTEANAETSAETAGETGADTSAETKAEAADKDAEDVRDNSTLAFDPAAIGLPGLPQPMRSAEDFQAGIDLINTRLSKLENALEQAQAEAAAAAETGVGAEEAAGGLDAQESGSESDSDSGPDSEVQSSTPDAAAEAIAGQIELLRQLRIAVQRRATLAERMADIGNEVAQRQAQLETIKQEGVALEPPFSISQLDQQQAELGLKQAMEDVAETRLDTASRRLVTLEKAVTSAVRERRTARDQMAAAEDDDMPQAERAALARTLELARLRELLARQQLTAGEGAVALARQDNDLAEAEQQVLEARLAFLDARAELSPEMLEQRLAELTDTEAEMRKQIEALERDGDRAESALYEARRRLADATEDADKAALEAWVTARQAQLDAARNGVDSLTAAITDLGQMRQLWQARFEMMQSPDSINGAEQLRDAIKALNEARAEKDDIERRLNALRAIQLTQSRALRDPTLDTQVREAMTARAAALDAAEQHGRELLETKDELIALLQGIRHQLEGLVENTNVSLQWLQAKEAMAGWWDAELIVINDQSIRVRELALALVIFTLVLLVLPTVRVLARRALRKLDTTLAEAEQRDLRLALTAIAGNTSQLFVLIAAFYVAMVFSGLASPTVKDWLWTLLVIAFYMQLGAWANAAMFDYFSRKRTRQEMRDPSTVTGYGLLMFFIRVGIWISVVVSLLVYFRYPVAGLVGALGVGSLAVAFAVQNILGDVFSSMAIILDKPFRVGDFVKAGETVGTIELIGIKTTRIRSLSGEQVVLSNSDLLNSRIHNFKYFRERRISFNIGVVYQTPRELLERIPDMIRQSIEEQPQTRFDRAHFFAFGDFSLNFEIVYYVLTPDYAIYMDIQQGINLGIHRRFEEVGIEFAYPTQELILRRAPMAAAAFTAVPASQHASG
ncbi:mechanosensitive ion channel domain-containing protein [Thiorhodovibrio frisius]|uniref:Small-conductance mechanosensitive channel n=1 Tax=Thiorhodovibrio frisius TaxID=631362 RepID=H8YWX3_9GAMM|nr:mechanosensitive ion channel family protein [Thiorhodovibrio frisius]EIC22949.1 small-conductance mechanosensitive channel [Thiorhodovibrio frisius]WPL22789.1 Small-conductance mechanosensitive channel [Thiorhodovibrio frisius]